MSPRLTITFDANGPRRLAEFWATALDYQVVTDRANDDFVPIVDADGHGPRLLFLKVPESKSAKNRVHLDIHSDVTSEMSLEDHQVAIAAIVSALTAAGATQGESFVERVPWTVMYDPEGNEFCVV